MRAIIVGSRLSIVLLLLCSWAGANAQGVFQSLLTEKNVDFAQTAEFPPQDNPDQARRVAVFTGAFHIRLPLLPHASWGTASTLDAKRYLRLTFTEPLPVGTIIGSAGEVSYLKADAPYPGDVTNEALWVRVPTPEGQAGMRVIPFPVGVTTRAIRFSFDVGDTHGNPSSSGMGGLLIIKERLHNLTPEATPFASSQVTGADNVVEANRVQNLVRGGTWSAAPKQDIAPEHPEWVILSWPAAKPFVGVGFINAFAKHLEIDALNPTATGNPAVVPEKAWIPVGKLDWPIWWRPAYTDAYVPFTQRITTRALRVRITQPLTKEDPDIDGATRGSRRMARLSGVLAFTPLGIAPVPPRPKVAAEPPPIKIAYTMPYAGKLALSINDASGKRVRNLVAEVERAAGPHAEFWDGRDDAGKIVPPGKYTWKIITHQALHLSYQATVNCSGNPPWWKSSNWGDQTGPGSWLSDHAAPNDVTVIGDRVFIGAVIAESGHTILACDLDGNKVWGTKWLETAGAGFLTNDGSKVYSAGEGGWIGDRLYIHEIDPATFKWRRVTQLVFDSGNTATGGVTGIAAKDGKLYVAFNRPERSWLRSGIASATIDAQQTSPGDNLLNIWRTQGDVPSGGDWHADTSTNQLQYLRMAFTTPQPVGTLLLPSMVEVSALKADAAYPGDLARDDQWQPFTMTPAGAYVLATAPPDLQTRALRFTFRKLTKDLLPWQGSLAGGMLLTRRFADVTAGASYTASSGTVSPTGGWGTVRDTIINPDDPVSLIASWPQAKTFRGLAFRDFFAKRVEVSAYTGAADADPRTAPDAAWTPLGEMTPTVRWRVAMNDDYFDAGRNVTTTAIRLRVLEPLTNENADIASTTGGKPTRAGLGGMVVLQAIGGDPAFQDIPTQRISVVDIATGKWERDIAVPEPRFPHFDANGNLLMVSGKQIVRLSVPDGAITPVISTGLDDPRGIAFDAQGNLYVADGGPKQVKVFAPNGTPLRTIATAGGRQLGSYDQTRIENPQGIGIDQRGHLWITENDYQPKRTSLWTTDGKFLNEFIGPAQYGAGGFLDPKDKSRFYYNGVEYGIDWTTGAWKITQVFARTQPAFSGGRTDHPVYLNGKQYMVNDPAAMGSQLLLVGEYRGDRVYPMTVVGNADCWAPFTDDPALHALVKGKTLNTYSFVWTDQNGDSLPQPEEVTLSEPGVRLNSTYWPTYVSKKLEVQLGGRLLKPTSFSAAGVPVYQPFAVKPLPAFPAENIYATAVDSQGRVLVNGRPVLAMTTDGVIDFSYPQHWVGVHDSQRAPSHQPGQLIGGLGFIGQEDVPGLGPTFMLNGNKGEWYLFTEDCMLAATIWHDYREPGAISWNFPEAKRGMSLDAVTIGEEHFGGGYVRTSDGKYYLIAGHNHNSIAELSGLDTMKRQQGTFALTAAQIKQAEDWTAHQAMVAAQQELPKVLTIAAPAAPVKPDGNLQEWQDDQFISIGDRGAVAVTADATNLYLAYRVNNGNTLRNGGDDPNMLFKTGDSVDLQIGANPLAAPTRTAPVPGDQRLLISTFQGKPIGVLYQHRVLNTPAAQKTAFASPWRTEYVDRIQRLDPANIAIGRTPQGYTVEAVVPLALLGLRPTPGATYKIDFGILTGNSAGGATQLRTYWANQATGVVSDVPSEIMLTPGLWGSARFE